MPIANDKGQTTDDPCYLFCGPEDIESWGRVVAQLRGDALATLDAMAGKGLALLPYSSPLTSWWETSERFAITDVGVGFELLVEFGAVDNSNIVNQQIEVIRNGAKLIGEAKAQLGPAAPPTPGSLEEQGNAAQAAAAEWSTADLAKGAVGVLLAVLVADTFIRSRG